MCYTWLPKRPCMGLSHPYWSPIQNFTLAHNCPENGSPTKSYWCFTGWWMTSCSVKGLYLWVIYYNTEISWYQIVNPLKWNWYMKRSLYIYISCPGWRCIPIIRAWNVLACNSVPPQLTTIEDIRGGFEPRTRTDELGAESQGQASPQLLGDHYLGGTWCPSAPSSRGLRHSYSTLSVSTLRTDFRGFPPSRLISIMQKAGAALAIWLTQNG